MDLEGLVRAHGYTAVLVGTLLEGESVVAIGGFFAHRGYLDLPLVMAAAFAGSLVVDQLFFLAGRRGGASVLARHPRWQPGAARAKILLDRHGTWLALGFRFLYGFRTITPFAIGMSSISFARFAALNAVGAALWAAAFATAGYLFGAAFTALLGDLRRHETWILAALALCGAAFWIWHHVRWRRACALAGSPRRC